MRERARLSVRPAAAASGSKTAHGQSPQPPLPTPADASVLAHAAAKYTLCSSVRLLAVCARRITPVHRVRPAVARAPLALRYAAVVVELHSLRLSRPSPRVVFCRANVFTTHQHPISIFLFVAAMRTALQLAALLLVHLPSACSGPFTFAQSQPAHGLPQTLLYHISRT